MQKKLNLFIIMLLITTVFFGYISYPVMSSLIFSTGFEDGILNTQYSNSWLTSSVGTSDAGEFEVNNIDVYSGGKSFYINGDNDVAFFNYTYTDNYMIEWETWFLYGEDVNSVTHFYFYNSSNMSHADLTNPTALALDCFIRFRIMGAGDNVSYADNNGKFQDIVSGLSKDTWYNFKFRVIDIDVVEYSAAGTVVLGTPLNTTGQRIDAISVYMTSSPDISFDNHKITTSNVYEGEEFTDFSAYYTIGQLSTSSFLQINYKEIEETYYVPVSADFVGLDLVINGDMFSGDLDLNNYYAYLNGNSLGTANYWISFEDHYILRWDFIDNYVSLIDEFPLLEFHRDSKYSGQAYWMVGANSIDLDADGDILYKYSNDNPNGWYDGSIQSFDLSYRLYFTGATYEPDYNYTDYIGIKDIPPYYTYENIPISYSISTKEYDNYIEIWKDGERIGSESGFGSNDTNGLFLTEFSGTVGFVPLIAGAYSVNIRRNTINVTSYSFTVLDNPITDYYIYTIRNPSTYLNSFTVYYKYLHGEGKEGILTLNNIQSFSNPTSHLYYIYLVANTTGNFSYTPTYPYPLLYISMGIEISTDRYTLASFPENPYIHYIQDFSSSNYIEVTYDNLNLDIQQMQQITGHHNHISAYIYVTDNGEIVQDVSNKNSFTFSYTVVNGGLHEVKLVLSTTNGTVTLDTKYYSASIDVPEEEEEDEFAVLGEYKLWLGVGIIVIFLLLPLVVSIKSFVDVPLIVYIAMGSIGTGVSVSLGLIETYWLLLLMVALVTGAIISKWG